jgi:hypothetical protein
MKKLALVSVLGAALAHTSLSASTTFYPPWSPARTNTYLVTCPVPYTATLSVTAAGVGAAYQVGTITITDAPGTSGANVLGINLGGTISAYYWTNTATDVTNVLGGSDAAVSATNLFLVLRRDFPGIITRMADSNQLTLTVHGTSIAFTNTSGWCTNSVATNAAAGTITCLAEGSLDLSTWSHLPQLDLSLDLSAGSVSTNVLAVIYGIPYARFTVASVSTNGSCTNFVITAKTQ